MHNSRTALEYISKDLKRYLGLLCLDKNWALTPSKAPQDNAFFIHAPGFQAVPSSPALCQRYSTPISHLLVRACMDCAVGGFALSAACQLLAVGLR